MKTATFLSRNPISVTLGVLAAGLLSSLAFAQAPTTTPDPAKKATRAAKMQERLKAADKNGDGKISREEAAASMPKLAKHFDLIDANKDGFITAAEMKAWHDQRASHKAQQAPAN